MNASEARALTPNQWRLLTWLEKNPEPITWEKIPHTSRRACFKGLEALVARGHVIKQYRPGEPPTYEPRRKTPYKRKRKKRTT